METKKRTQREIAEDFLTKSEYPDGKSYELAQKFIDKYITINGVPVLRSPTPSGIIFYDEEKKVIAGEENWKDKTSKEDLDDVVFVIKTMVVGRPTEKELPEDAPDDVVIDMVHDKLVRQDEEKPMDVYSIHAIIRQPIVRYKVNFEGFEGHVGTKEEVEKWGISVGAEDSDGYFEEIDTPFSIVLVRFNRKKLW